MTKEFELLRSASNEIKSLRAQNNLMAARLDTFDKCVMMFTAHLPNNLQGMSPDLVYEIDRFIDSVNDKQVSNQ